MASYVQVDDVIEVARRVSAGELTEDEAKVVLELLATEDDGEGP